MEELYREQILEHYKRPHNFGVLEHPDLEFQDNNPFCGDEQHVTIRLDDEGKVAEVNFDGKGCAISKSSASLMTTLLKGKTVRDAENLFVQFHRMVTSNPDAPIDEKAIGKLAVFSGVRELPVRIKGATHSWHAVLRALRGAGEAVTAEEARLARCRCGKWRGV